MWIKGIGEVPIKVIKSISVAKILMFAMEEQTLNLDAMSYTVVRSVVFAPTLKEIIMKRILMASVHNVHLRL